MKIGIMQPYVFPYIGYFQTLNAVDSYVIYDDIQFIKGGWINRNNILIGGRKTLFTFSLKDASPNRLINEIDINDDFNKFIKTLSMAYSWAPYKDAVLPLVQRICDYKDKNLARFIGNSLKEISEYLGITTKLLYSSDLRKDTQLKAQDKVIAICEELGADTYINAIGGQELYSRDDFEPHGIDLKFMKNLPIEYKQFGKEFVGSLSIIDVMMFNSIEDISIMLDSYELI